MTEPATETMRILLLGPLPPPVGGMATVVDNLRQSLSSRHDVHVINNRKSTAPDRSLWQGIAAQLKLLRELQREISRFKPDVVHIHTCSFTTFWRNGIDVLLARLLGRKVVLHIHGAMFHHFLDGLGGGTSLLARTIFRLCHRVIALGDQWQQVLAPWAGADKVVVVPNGVPVPEQAADLTTREPQILCFANYERRKGQADLLHALAGLGRKDVRLGLYGFESEAGERLRLQELAEELALTDQVRIPGPVTGEEKDRVMSQASLFVLPSYDEGLPMAMLEAMAAGLPVVVTRVGAIPEAVIDGEEGLIYEAGDTANLQRALKRLIADPAQTSLIALAGRQRVINEFSLAHTTALLDRLYQTLS